MVGGEVKAIIIVPTTRDSSSLKRGSKDTKAVKCSSFIRGSKRSIKYSNGNRRRSCGRICTVVETVGVPGVLWGR